MIIFVLTLLSCFSLAGTDYTVHKVRIKSSLLGKDRYADQYLLESGDTFKEDLHQRSLLLLKDGLIADGYLDVKISDEVKYNDQEETVGVTLTIDSGDRYKIADVQLILIGNDDEELQNELRELIAAPLVGAYAQKDVLDEQGSRIRSVLDRKGYKKPQITLMSTRENAAIAVTYSVSIKEQQAFVFEGNHFFSAEDLHNEIYALKEKGVVLPPSLIAHDIEEQYKKKGFLGVTVDWHVELEQISFYIGEGPRYTIRSVTIKDTFTDAAVLSLLQERENDLISLPAYDQVQVDAKIHQTSEDLLAFGYWDIIFTTSVIPATESPSVDITLTVSQVGSPENIITRKMVRNIVIEQFDELITQEPFLSWHSLKTAQPIKPSDIDEQRRALMRFLQKQGFLTATVSFTIEDEILHWSVNTQGGPVHFGPITIAGLNKMKPFIVRRELCFDEGALWDPHLIDKSLLRLKGLDIFDSIAFHPQPIEEQGNHLVKPLLIKCCEVDPIELRSRFGLQVVSKSFTNISWSTWKLGGSFIYNNPTGYADRFIFDADWTRYTRNVAATYEVPWIGSVPVKTRFKVYSDRFDQPLISSNDYRLYEESHDGVSVTFAHDHPWWSTCVRYGFEFNQLSGIERRLAQVIQFEPTLVDKRTPYVYFEPSVTFEHFDDKANPSKGYFTTLSLKAMIPYGVQDGWFVRMMLEQSFFYPLYETLVGAVRWRFGHIFNARFSTILPTERFYLGGANSLRGYETNMAPPLNDITCDDKCLFVPVGGKTMANVNAELRFPLYKRLSGVLFTDMGILTQDKFADIAANRWLGATGLGLRLGTPVGPIRFDIGWKWHKRDPADKSYALFLTFGHAF